MLMIKNGKIMLTRGDSAYINVDLTTSTGEVYEMQAGDAQTMPCAGKKMLKDVDIKAIPFFETSNEAGTTVYIAAEVD